MNNAIKAGLSQWSRETNERQKLQHLYFALAITLIVAAGLVGLVNYEVGQQLLLAAIATLLIFAINTVVWALLHTFVLVKLSVKAAVQKTARSKK